jgi:Lrp/AsnC family leucine-responsive transcriptional regulator
VISGAIDDIDRVILSELIRNGRSTYRDLGLRAELSPHAVAPRVRRLVQLGVIKAFTTTIDHGAVGRGLDALIDISLLSTARPEAFEQSVAKLPAALELSFVTGRFDYLLRVACIDADDLDHTVRALRAAGAAVTETRILLRSTTYTRDMR